MLSPTSFSTKLLNFLNVDRASDFSDKKNTHVFLVRSSMKVIKYFFLLFDYGVTGP